MFFFRSTRLSSTELFKCSPVIKDGNIYFAGILRKLLDGVRAFVVNRRNFQGIDSTWINSAGGNPPSQKLKNFEKSC
jgi:hypothetical protein